MSCHMASLTCPLRRLLRFSVPTYLGKTEPGADKLRLVGHVDGHAVALDVAAAQEKVGNPAVIG